MKNCLKITEFLWKRLNKTREIEARTKVLVDEKNREQDTPQTGKYPGTLL